MTKRTARILEISKAPLGAPGALVGPMRLREMQACDLGSQALELASFQVILKLWRLASGSSVGLALSALWHIILRCKTRRSG